MYTITLNGSSSELSCDIFPPLEVDNSSQLCLLSLQSNNSIPNIEAGCNAIGFRNSLGGTEHINLPTGSYELSTLESNIQKLLPSQVTMFQLRANENTLKCLMTCSHEIDFTIENNISRILGFKNIVYSAEILHESERLINIMKVNCIKIECNLISGSFNDGVPSQTIHAFFPSVPQGYTIIEVPRHPVFYPLNTSTISKVNISAERSRR